MTNEEAMRLAGEINAALRGGDAPAVVERPAALPANPTEGQRRKHAEDNARYAQYLIDRRGPLTTEEQIFLASGIRDWNNEGRP